MNTAKILSGSAVASAAAALLMSGFTVPAQAESEGTEGAEGVEANVKCSGINSCKGSSACATANNACKGMNSCKGSGWLEVSKEECESKEGTIL
jgi:hypothetical protein